jgi:hypothetical protein
LRKFGQKQNSAHDGELLAATCRAGAFGGLVQQGAVVGHSELHVLDLHRGAAA